MPTQDMNLMKLTEMFHSDERCRSYLESLRWPDGVRCIRCDSAKISRSYKRNQFVCDSCDYNFSVTAGSIFHDTKLGLPKWFMAVYLMGESRKGISANQMKRTLNVTYKTAWYLCHRIRAAMRYETAAKLKGIVEADETYVGGKRRGKIRGGGRGFKGNKTMVLGAVERGGQVRFKIDKRDDRKTLHAFIDSVVADGAEAIFTDAHAEYVGIGDENTRHESVNHNQNEWVRAQVHTNTVEGVWSLFKRSIVGSYHQLSAKHLDSYLDEMAWRFNNRENPYLFRDTLVRLLKGETLEYKELIA